MTAGNKKRCLEGSEKLLKEVKSGGGGMWEEVEDSGE